MQPNNYDWCIIFLVLYHNNYPRRYKSQIHYGLSVRIIFIIINEQMPTLKIVNAATNWRNSRITYFISIYVMSISNKMFLGNGLGDGDKIVILCLSISTPVLKVASYNNMIDVDLKGDSNIIYRYSLFIIRNNLKSHTLHRL